MDTLHRPFRSVEPPIDLRSQLVQASEHAVPQLEDLLALEKELAILQTGAKARADRASANLGALDAVYRKAKEKRGKVKKDKERTVDQDRSATSVTATIGGGIGKDHRERERLPVVKIKREYSGERDFPPEFPLASDRIGRLA